ncbi:Uncharacterised protein [Vibrio cholerae]|nr:Uncharacterised protein [Vibrio cholerae]
MSVDQTDRVHALLSKKTWDKMVNRTNRHHCYPTKRTRVNVTNRPVGVVG